LGQSFFNFSFSISYKTVDREGLEYVGPIGLTATVLKIGSDLHKAKTRYLYHYTFSIIIGVTLLMILKYFIFNRHYRYFSTAYFLEILLTPLSLFALIVFAFLYLKSMNTFSHNSLYDIIWITTPAIWLYSLTGPSFALLYSTDEIIESRFTFKLVGYPWYWHFVDLVWLFLFASIYVWGQS